MTQKEPDRSVARHRTLPMTYALVNYREGDGSSISTGEMSLSVGSSGYRNYTRKNAAVKQEGNYFLKILQCSYIPCPKGPLKVLLQVLY